MMKDKFNIESLFVLVCALALFVAKCGTKLLLSLL